MRYGPDVLLDDVRHWLDSGGSVRLIRVTGATAEIELRACTGEGMERRRTSDSALLAQL